MAQNILWPQVSPTPPQTMAEMLYDAAAGLGQISNNKLDFYIDAVGVAPNTFGPVTQIRYNCYIRVIQKGYLHLLFQVTTPSNQAFAAEVGTPEGDIKETVRDQNELTAVIARILQRSQTRETIDYLLRVATP